MIVFYERDTVELVEYLHCISYLFLFFFFKQKTAYEIGTGDWSSDVCSSDLVSRDTFQISIETT